MKLVTETVTFYSYKNDKAESNVECEILSVYDTFYNYLHFYTLS